MSAARESSPTAAEIRVPSMAGAPVAAGPDASDPDLWGRVKKRFPRVSSDLKALLDMEDDLKGRQAREPLADQQVTELLKRFQVLGDKIKVQAPEEAGQVYRRGMSYLGWIREPLLASVWRDDFEKRVGR
jgi:hypothetical protein